MPLLSFSPSAGPREFNDSFPFFPVPPSGRLQIFLWRLCFAPVLPAHRLFAFPFHFLYSFLFPARMPPSAFSGETLSCLLPCLFSSRQSTFPPIATTLSFVAISSELIDPFLYFSILRTVLGESLSSLSQLLLLRLLVFSPPAAPFLIGSFLFFHPQYSRQLFFLCSDPNRSMKANIFPPPFLSFPRFWQGGDLTPSACGSTSQWVSLIRPGFEFSVIIPGSGGLRRSFFFPFFSLESPEDIWCDF